MYDDIDAQKYPFDERKDGLKVPFSNSLHTSTAMIKIFRDFSNENVVLADLCVFAVPRPH